jgi:acyl-coenzyme A synthetase/AMP-(fatty) acid ligase
MPMISLLSSCLIDRPIAFFEGRVIRTTQFLSHVKSFSKILKKHQYNINLCENRYHFLVVFAASALLKQISLLPSSRLQSELERLKNDYSDSYQISDSTVAQICKTETNEIHFAKEDLLIKKEQIVAIVFTSGTTGTPTAHSKTWGQLVGGAKRVKQRFSFNKTAQHTIVATVPPQHMFGFETTIIYPLVNEIMVHADCPFYPLDINNTLSQIISPVILITTPLHLKICHNAKINWHNIDFIISATAALSYETALKTEDKLKTKVLEIYGCSEVGAIATRHISKSNKWQLLENYVLNNQDSTILTLPEYKDAIIIPDTVKIYDGYYFELLQRNNDLIKIGGKRESLSNLTQKLKNMEGVEDCIFLIPDKKAHQRVHLIAFVVAPKLEVKEVREYLLNFIDPVFLPKPIRFFEELPYNEFGKLPKANLLALLK